MNRRRVHLVRHGQSTWNERGLIQGSVEHPPLTELGRTQAIGAAVYLSGVLQGPSTLISSELLRCRQTAEIVAGGLRGTLDAPVFVHDLRERSAGVYEGTPRREAEPLPVPRGLSGADVSWPGGESVVAVFERTTAVLDEWRYRGTGDLVLVSHVVVMRCLLTALEGRGAHQLTERVIGHGEVLSREL